MQLTDVIIKPYLTEKSYTLRAGDKKKYAFIVNLKATKNDIALAFEALFEVAPASISTMVRKSVATRTGTAHPGYTKAFKIAYITLPAGSKDIFLSKEEFEAAAKGKEAPANIKATEKPVAVKEVKAEVKDIAKDSKVETSSKKEAWRKATNKNY